MKALVYIALLLGLAGCATTRTPFLSRSYHIGQADSCVAGNPLLSVSEGVNISSSLMNPITDGITHELVYAGLTDSVLSLLYREYAIREDGSYARAAFALPMQYDLRHDRVIAFRDYRIRILSASSQLIRFIVERDGSLTGDGTASNGGTPRIISPALRKAMTFRLSNGAVVSGYVNGETATHFYVTSRKGDAKLGVPLSKSNVVSSEPIE